MEDQLRWDIESRLAALNIQLNALDHLNHAKWHLPVADPEKIQIQREIEERRAEVRRLHEVLIAD